MTAQSHEYGTMPFGAHDVEGPMARENVIARFKTIGATDKEADVLADSNDEQHVASVSNQDLQGMLDEYRLAGNIDLDNLTVPKVTEWVGDNPDRAKVVADLEAARDKTRAGVTNHLETVAPEAVAEAQNQPADAPAEPSPEQPVPSEAVQQAATPEVIASESGEQPVVNESGQATDAQ